MKMPSLRLESKVILTAVAIYIYGFLRMAHAIRLSDQYEVGFLFLIALVLVVLVLPKDRTSSARNAVWFLCFGLIFWNLVKPDKSISGVYFNGLLIATSGAGLFICVYSMLKYLRRSKVKASPEISAEK